MRNSSNNTTLQQNQMMQSLHTQQYQLQQAKMDAQRMQLNMSSGFKLREPDSAGMPNLMKESIEEPHQAPSNYDLINNLNIQN